MKAHLRNGLDPLCSLRRPRNRPVRFVDERTTPEELCKRCLRIHKRARELLKAVLGAA